MSVTVTRKGRNLASIFAGAWLAAIGSGGAQAQEKITYLLPARRVFRLRALVLAKHLGYYKDAGYDVEFVVARGGVDVAKQVGSQCGIGGAIGDTPIIVRANGVPVKVVGLMGAAP